MRHSTVKKAGRGTHIMAPALNGAYCKRHREQQNIEPTEAGQPVTLFVWRAGPTVSHLWA
jgi:hypothetical protein